MDKIEKLGKGTERMRDYIAGFCKTDHFIHRQWDRSINDSLLVQILRNIKTDNSNTLLIVSRNILKKFNHKLNKELFIKIDNKVLITCFYCEFKEYQAINRCQNYKIINKI